MTRDRDLDALAEALEYAQRDRPTWLARLARRVLAKLAGPAIAAVGLAAVGLAVVLALVGVDLGWLLMAMFYASPLLAVAVAIFIASAWQQNLGLTYTPLVSQVNLATEPAQPALAHPAGQPGQGEPANLPARPTTVTVTVLPGPVAALPQAVGHTTPIRDAEEETR